MQAKMQNKWIQLKRYHAIHLYITVTKQYTGIVLRVLNTGFSMSLPCVRTLVMSQCFGSVMWTLHPQPLLSQHYSPHLTARRIRALEVLAPAPRVACGWQRMLGKARLKSQCTVPGLLSVKSTLFCSANLLSRTQGSVFPLLPLWSPTSCRLQRLQLC